MQTIPRSRRVGLFVLVEDSSRSLRSAPALAQGASRRSALAGTGSQVETRMRLLVRLHLIARWFRWLPVVMARGLR